MTGIENIVIGDLINPATIPGAIFYAVLVSTLAILASRTVRRLVRHMMGRGERSSSDRTVLTFLSRLAQVASYIIAAILYCHLLRPCGRWARQFSPRRARHRSSWGWRLRTHWAT
jgi:hypothetical protein